jgi:hypothetical protein
MSVSYSQYMLSEVKFVMFHFAVNRSFLYPGKEMKDTAGRNTDAAAVTTITAITSS